MNVRRKAIDRITITGDNADRERAIAFFFKRGYRLKSIGPQRLRGMLWSTTRFKMVAERDARKKTKDGDG